MRILPSSDRASFVRVSLLLIALVATVIFTEQILHFGAGSGLVRAFKVLFTPRITETLSKLPNFGSGPPPQDVKYVKSLLDQTTLLALCESSISRRGAVPSSLEDLRVSHSGPLPTTDPWGRAFVIRSLDHGVCAIQSLGPSGQNRLKQLSEQEVAQLPTHKQFYVGDNLIVVGGPHLPSH